MSAGLEVILFWGLVTLVAVAFSLFLQKRQRIVKMIDKLPGPKSFPILGFAYEFIGVPREDVLSRTVQMLEKYITLGIFRIWVGPLPVVLLTKPEYIEVLLSSKVHIDKSYIYTFLNTWLGKGLLTSTDQKWFTRRKLLTPAFHFRILEDFIPIFNEQSKILVKKMKSMKDDDLFRYITLCSLDIICGTAMGCDISAQLNEDSEYVEAVHKATEGIFFRCRSPWYYPNLFYNLSPAGRKFNHYVNILKRFTRKIIKERRAEMEQRNGQMPDKESEAVSGRKRKLAFLDILLKYSNDGHVLSDDDIQEEVDTFMFEGHDTTTAAIYWVLFLLGQNKAIQEKVHEELDSIFSDSDRPVLSEDLPKLKYLEYVCKESLRLIPPVPLIARQIKEDLKIGNNTIPAGVQCIVSPMITHHLEYIYPQSLKFDPDRFLPDNCQGRHPYAYIPFSAGPRNCIGQKFAAIEKKVVLANILREFKVSTVPIPDVKLPFLVEIITRPSSYAKINVYSRRR